MRWYLLAAFLVVVAASWSFAQADTVDEPQCTISENLVLNGSFEQALMQFQTDVQIPGCSISRDEERGCDGDCSLRICSREGGRVLCPAYDGPVEGGRRYRFECKYSSSKAGGNEEAPPAPQVSIWMRSPTSPGSEAIVIGSHMAEDWQDLIAEVTTPPDATTVTVRVGMQGQSGTAWFDSIKFGPLVLDDEPVVTAPDGNLLFNADMESGCLGQPCSWQGGSQRAGIYRQWLQYDKQGYHLWCEDNPHSGTHCLACEIKDPEKVPYIYWMQQLWLKPGTTYKLTGWLRAEGKSSVKLSVVTDGQRGLAREEYKTGYVGPGPWRCRMITFTTPEWDGLSRGGYVGAVGGKEGKFFVDDVRFEEVAGELKDVAASIASDCPGNIFPSPDKVKLTLTLKNESGDPKELMVSWQVGTPGEETPSNRVWKRTRWMRVPPGEPTEVVMDSLVKKAGIYLLRVKVTAKGNEVMEQEVQFAAMGGAEEAGR